jgi:hypothetical protein
VRRSVKILLWTAVFLACAAAGAVVASRTDPFPPGVEDPGARPSSPATSASPSSTVLALTGSAETRHELHVGGVCTSAWEIRLEVEVAADASATGAGDARILEGWGCPFADTGQVQAERIRLAARGHVEDGTLLLALRETGERTPVGSIDLGGLVETVARVRLTLPVDGAADVVRVEKPDGNLGRYVGRYRVRAACSQGC